MFAVVAQIRLLLVITFIRVVGMRGELQVVRLVDVHVVGGDAAVHDSLFVCLLQAEQHHYEELHQFVFTEKFLSPELPVQQSAEGASFDPFANQVVFLILPHAQD